MRYDFVHFFLAFVRLSVCLSTTHSMAGCRAAVNELFFPSTLTRTVKKLSVVVVVVTMLLYSQCFFLLLIFAKESLSVSPSLDECAPL